MHYICDKRMINYGKNLDREKYGDEYGLLKRLENVGWKEIDLDNWEIPFYLKKQICVLHCRQKCEYRSRCRYQMLLRDSRKEKYDFQIVNHGYVLGDMLREKNGEMSQLPDYDVLIFDEAHKLRDTARQMYGVTLSERKLIKLARPLADGTEREKRKKQRLIDLRRLEEGQIDHHGDQRQRKRVLSQVIKHRQNILRTRSTAAMN